MLPAHSKGWDVGDFWWDDERLVATPSTSVEPSQLSSRGSADGGLCLQPYSRCGVAQNVQPALAHTHGLLQGGVRKRSGRKQDRVAPVSHPVEGEGEGGGPSAPAAAVHTITYNGRGKMKRACRIGGCPGVCDNAYTARSRVCHTHMKAGKTVTPMLAP
jgi:hypothetical protein